jgi:hypothetical protein
MKMIKEIELNNVIVKVATKNNNDEECIVTLTMEAEGYYIIDAINYCKVIGLKPLCVYVYEATKIQPDVYMIQRNGAIQWLDDYYD